MSLRINAASPNLNPTTQATRFNLGRIAHHRQVGPHPSKREFFVTSSRRIVRSAWALGPGVPPDIGDAFVGITLNGGGGNGQPSVSEGYTTNAAAAGIHILPNVPFAVHFDAFSTLLVDNITAQYFTAALVLAGINGTSLDFFNTVHLSLDLPAGASVLSDGGFSQIASVPEPSTYGLLLGGLSLLGLRARWRSAAGSRPLEGEDERGR